MTHLAIPLIREAETTPVFRFGCAPVDLLLATASQTEPESLDPLWVLRLAHRYVDVLLQDEQTERAAVWLGIAEGLVGEAPPVAHVDHAVLTARMAVRAHDELGARRALAEAQKLLPSVGDAQDRKQRRTRIDIAMCEIHTVRGVFGAIAPLLEGRLNEANAFASIDELWRAQRLLAFAAQVRLEFDEAVKLYQTTADLCSAHDAPRDQAEALIGRGQCLLGAGDEPGAKASFQRAYALADVGDQTHKNATGALVAGLLATGELDDAVDTARQSAIAAAGNDDYRSYVEFVGVVTHLYRIQQRHKDAYRALLGIYGTLKQKFGDEATTPITDLINLLKADLGDGFEVMAAELLAEVKARG